MYVFFHGYVCVFAWFSWFLEQNHAVFPHVFSHTYVFLSVFSMFFDSNLPTTPSVNWKICLVGAWCLVPKIEETLHQSYLYGI